MQIPIHLFPIGLAMKSMHGSKLRCEVESTTLEDLGEERGGVFAIVVSQDLRYNTQHLLDRPVFLCHGKPIGRTWQGENALVRSNAWYFLSLSCGLLESCH